MKGIFYTIIGFLWLAGLYFGYIHVVGKVMKPKPKVDSTRAATLQEQQRQTARDVREKQKRLMQERQTRVRDHRR